jgi:hypothetical protein
LSCGSEVGDEEPVGTATEALDIGGLGALRAMSLNGHYRLTANITMSSTDAPFVPIGSPFNPFTGTFDGNGFTINNLRIGTGTSRWYTGLFGATDGATLSRVRLNNVNIVGQGETGAIVGSMSNTTLTDCSVTGTVTGTSFSVGMVVGLAGNWTNVQRCYATGTVTGAATPMGGFFGSITTSGFDDLNNQGPPAKINEIFTNVNVNPTTSGDPGTFTAGGLAGYVEGAVIEDINVVGPVKGRGEVGGVIGSVTNDNPYTQATVLLDALSRAIVTDLSTNRAGVVGAMRGNFLRCDAFYDLADAGTPLSTSDVFCNAGFSAADLKRPHPSPNKLIYPYTIGQVVTQQAINQGIYSQCKLASGSDRDWGFGTCGTTQTWALNSDQEHITLTRIPNPSVQPK